MSLCRKDMRNYKSCYKWRCIAVSLRIIRCKVVLKYFNIMNLNRQIPVGVCVPGQGDGGGPGLQGGGTQYRAETNLFEICSPTTYGTCAHTAHPTRNSRFARDMTQKPPRGSRGSFCDMSRAKSLFLRWHLRGGYRSRSIAESPRGLGAGPRGDV